MQPVQDQALSSSREIARRMNRAASALLPPSFWPSSCSRATDEVGEHQVEGRRPLQGARREGGLEAGDGVAGVLDRVALRLDELAELGPGGVGGRSRRSPSVRLSSLVPSSLAGTGSGVGVTASDGAGARPSAIAPPPPSARHSDSRTLIASSSHQRPSRQIDSRERPSITKPTARVGADRPLVELEHGQGDPVEPERPEGVVDHQRVASVP